MEEAVYLDSQGEPRPVEDPLLKQIIVTNPFPTDPVILRQDLAGAEANMARVLSRVARETLREENSTIDYVPAGAAEYDVMEQLFRAFDEEIGRISR